MLEILSRVVGVVVLLLVVGSIPGGHAQPSQRVITQTAASATAVYAADLNGDGARDVLSASLADNKIAWYENQIGDAGADRDGFGEQQTITTRAEGALSVFATDLDEDGDADVLSASSYDDRIAWYENQLGDSESDGDGFGDPRTITTEAAYAASVYAADLNGDGTTEVLSASRADDRIAWYENQIGEAGADADGFGRQQTITTNADEAQSVFARDLNGDDRADVLSASTNDDKIAWYPNSDRALPVELVAFEGRKRGAEAVTLSWQTASERQNARFEVQRKEAQGGAAWTTIGRVRGSGTTTEPRSYRYVDSDLPAADSLFYRLRQVDVDGTVHLSGVVAVVRTVRQVRLEEVSPNPARNRVVVHYAVPGRAPGVLRLHDVLGREVRRVELVRADGRHQVRLDLSGLPSGTYFLRLVARGTQRATRLTVVR